jgi:hypothetical protein
MHPTHIHPTPLGYDKVILCIARERPPAALFVPQFGSLLLLFPFVIYSSILIPALRWLRLKKRRSLSFRYTRRPFCKNRRRRGMLCSLGAPPPPSTKSATPHLAPEVLRIHFGGFVRASVTFRWAFLITKNSFATYYFLRVRREDEIKLISELVSTRYTI